MPNLFGYWSGSLKGPIKLELASDPSERIPVSTNCMVSRRCENLTRCRPDSVRMELTSYCKESIAILTYIELCVVGSN